MQSGPGMWIDLVSFCLHDTVLRPTTQQAVSVNRVQARRQGGVQGGACAPPFLTEI